MIVNFEIKDSIALIYQGRYIDLHNNFDFECFTYDPKTRQLNLTFRKSTGDWVKSDEYKRLSLIHTNVFFLTTNYDNKGREFPNDDICLSDITFFPSTERGTNDRQTMQSMPNESDDILYIFQSDYFIRVGCDKIELLTIE